MNGIMVVILLILLVGLVSAESIFLSGYLEEGQTTVYETADGVYVLNLLSVSDDMGKAVFRLNDEMSKGIRLKDSYVFKDGSEIVLRELVISDAKDGSDEAYYYFYGTGKGVLELRNVSRYVVDNNLCNFDTQCLNEGEEDCCYDCGCNEEEECVNNNCVSIEKEAEKEEGSEVGIKEEEAEGGIAEEVEKEEAETEENEELTKDDKEKKAAYTMLIIIAIFIIIIAAFIMKRKRNLF